MRQSFISIHCGLHHIYQHLPPFWPVSSFLGFLCPACELTLITDLLSFGEWQSHTNVKHCCYGVQHTQNTCITVTWKHAHKMCKPWVGKLAYGNSSLKKVPWTIKVSIWEAMCWWVLSQATSCSRSSNWLPLLSYTRSSFRLWSKPHNYRSGKTVLN